MKPRIFVCIPVHNRLEIAKRCIPTVKNGMRDGDRLHLFNDGSRERMPMELLKLADAYVHDSSPIGIENQRQMHFRLFVAHKEYTHLYLTDQDALHDPRWREKLLELQLLSGGRPTCGYNTYAHVRLVGNTLYDAPPQPFILRSVAPGISYLLTRQQAEHVARVMPEKWNWDWTVPALLGSRMAIARPRCCGRKKSAMSE